MPAPDVLRLPLHAPPAHASCSATTLSATRTTSSCTSTWREAVLMRYHRMASEAVHAPTGRRPDLKQHAHARRPATAPCSLCVLAEQAAAGPGRRAPAGGGRSSGASTAALPPCARWPTPPQPTPPLQPPFPQFSPRSGLRPAPLSRSPAPPCIHPSQCCWSAWGSHSREGGGMEGVGGLWGAVAGRRRVPKDGRGDAWRGGPGVKWMGGSVTGWAVCPSQMSIMQ